MLSARGDDLARNMEWKATPVQMETVIRKMSVLIFVAILLTAYWFAFRAPAVGIFHDDGVYLATAKALAEGKGYRIISLPSELPQTKYPILFPAVLAIAWRLFPEFPDNALFLKSIPLLFAILWLWLSFKLIREETGSSDAALVIVLLTAASSGVVFFSTIFMSETFFAFITTWALIHLKRLEGNEDGIGLPLLFSAMLVAASFLIRTAGAPLVAAGTVALFLRRKHAAAVIFLCACIVFIAPWLWWQALQGDSSRVADSYYTVSSYKNWSILSNFSVEQKIHVVAKNIVYFIGSPIMFLNMKINTFTIVIGITLVLFTFYGFIKDMCHKVGSLHLFLLFYIIMIILWVWPPWRFLIPVYPLLIIFTYKGLCETYHHVFKTNTLRKIIYIIFVFSISFQMIDSLFLITKQTIKRQAVSLMVRKYLQADWKETKEIFEWIRGNTPQDSVLLGMLDPTYYLYTGRKAVRGYSVNPYLLYYSDKREAALGDVPDLVQRIVTFHARYVLRASDEFSPESKIFNGILDKLIIERPDALRLVKVGSDPSFMVYEVHRGKLIR